MGASSPISLSQFRHLYSVVSPPAVVFHAGLVLVATVLVAVLTDSTVLGQVLVLAGIAVYWVSGTITSSTS